MRIIDGDYAMEVLGRLGNRDYRREKGTIGDAIKALENEELIPTLDTEPRTPVQMGKWIMVSREVGSTNGKVVEKCSRCGREIKRREQTPQENFCPECGMQMKEIVEVQENEGE